MVSCCIAPVNALSLVTGIKPDSKDDRRLYFLKNKFEQQSNLRLLALKFNLLRLNLLIKFFEDRLGLQCVSYSVQFERLKASI